VQQVASLLHATQQLDGEERMSLGALVERLAEGIAQAVGLAVEQGIHKGTARRLFQVHYSAR
jgi:hypothetical protein